jgi:hypothetical protein
MSQRHRPQRRFRNRLPLAADPFPVLMALAVNLEIERPKLMARVEGGMPGEGTRRLRSTLDYNSPVQFLKGRDVAQQEGPLLVRTPSLGGRRTEGRSP